jgi:hypothetical protein
MLRTMVSSLQQLSHGQSWTSSADAWLREAWFSIPRVRDMAVLLGRTTGAVYEHAKKLHLPSRRQVTFTVNLFEEGPKIARRRLIERRVFDPVSRKRRRVCLGCQRPFRSAWAGNRLCGRCTEWASGLPVQ